MATNNTIIKISRGSGIEKNRRVALRRLMNFNHIIGQPVMVRYYTDPSNTSIDTIVAMGIKDGVGLDCFQLLSVFNKDIIYGISDKYEDFPVTKFPTNTERFIFIDPEKDNKAFYVTIGDDTIVGAQGRQYEEITDGPRIYEDVSTGHTIYLSGTNSVQIGSGYTNEEIDTLIESRLSVNQGAENAGKILIVGSDGKVTYMDVNDSMFYTAGENVEIDEDNVISVPDVVCQYSVMPPATDNVGKVAQYVGPTTDKLIQNRFYKADSSGWNLISIQSDYTNIVVLTKKEYRAIVEKDPDTLYFITESLDEDELDNGVFIYEIWASTMPEPDEDFEEECYIYTGEDTELYKKGHFYQCKRRFPNSNEFDWIDFTTGPAKSTSYQTLTSTENYLSASVKYVSTLDDIEDMYRTISCMKGFNGIIRVGNDMATIVRINGRRELSDVATKNSTYIDFTFISPVTYLPTTYSISASKSATDINLKFYLTIIS